MKKPRYPLHRRGAPGRRTPRKPLEQGRLLTKASVEKRAKSSEACVDKAAPKGRRRKHVPADVAVSLFENHLITTDSKVPANPNRPRLPFYKKIADNYGANIRDIFDRQKPHRAKIEALAQKHGLDVDVGYQNGPLTIAELTYIACVNVERELVAKGRDENQIKAALANTKSAFNVLAKKLEAGIDTAARPAIESALADARDLPQKARSELRNALGLLGDLLDDGLPADLAQTIHIICNRCAVGGEIIGIQIGLSAGALWKWRRGELIPTEQSKAALDKLEALAHLPAGALWNRRQRSSREIATLRGGERSGAIAPFFAFPSDWPLKRGVDGISAYRRPSRWPVQLAGERDDFMHFRGDAVCPFGMDRRKKIWDPGTQQFRDAEFGRLFGFMASGLGPHQAIARDDLSFVLLISTRFVHAYIAWREKRRSAREQRDKPRLTRVDLALFRTLRAMFESKYGFLVQRPDLIARLRPVALREGEQARWAISPEEVAAAKENWAGFCAKVFLDYNDLVLSHAAQVEDVTDHSSFETILELPNPLVAFQMGKAGLDAELVGLKRGTVSYAITLRDRAAWAIESQTAMRAETRCMMDYLEDNTGHLRDYGDRIEVVMDRSLFKNKDGPAFRDAKGNVWNFRRTLKDVDGAYEAIRAYIREGRPLLKKHNVETDALILSNLTGDRLTPIGSSKIIAATFNRHILYDPERRTGIIGTKPVSGGHWSRAVLATGVLKLTFSIQLAADAIHDSVETVQAYYVSYMPRDRSAALEAAIENGLSRAA